MNNFHKTIDALIEVNLFNRAEYSKNEAILSPLQWAKEFCTISVNVGRRTGKSEYVKRYAAVDDCVVVRNHQAMDYMDVRSNIFSVACIENMKGSHYRYMPEFIWVDDCNLNYEGRLLVYENFARRELTQTFVFLGE